MTAAGGDRGSFSLRGSVLVGEELVTRSATVVVEKGKIAAIEDERPRTEDCWICPAFFNAHVHLGDTVAMDLPAAGELESLVTPPDGLKHRILRATPRRTLVDGMIASITTMIAGGVAGFADFREGGVDGVRALLEAASGNACHAVIFGREGGEYIADGIGISSVRDVPSIDEKIAGARAAGKLIAFHAGEKDACDVDQALAFDPDLMVHCTHATDRQIAECADRGIPVVLCPRSNWALGVSRGPDHPPVSKMIELGCTILLGTDNAMFVQPDMLRELSFFSGVYRVTPGAALHAAVKGSDCLYSSFFIEEGNGAYFNVIDPSRSNLFCTHDHRRSIVNRVTGMDIVKKVFSPKN
jgi:cytosine/adenosine deaminase-related metal-dependent hydrolase